LKDFDLGGFSVISMCFAESEHVVPSSPAVATKSSVGFGVARGGSAEDEVPLSSL